ncbi:MAG: PEP/pyruvate-binding domain-containing protein [Acidobacteriota bacterium]
MKLSSGLPALDRILQGIRPGDNIVWQVDSIDDYMQFAKPFCDSALARGEKLIYFRYAKHKPVVSEQDGATVIELDPELGFERFITEIHGTIEAAGYGAFYVFDSMSELTLDCYSDRMIGNFFTLTCPFLYDLETVAYFAVLRNYHSFHAAEPISKTTQLLLDVYNYKGNLYVHPLKVYKRYSSTMYTLHLWDKEDFHPITESAEIAEILTSSYWPGLQSASYRQVGIWERRFLHAEEILESYKQGEVSDDQIDRNFKRLLQLVVSTEERVQKLAEKYLQLSDIIYIWKRMIGSGMIGGKSVGMLLARAILCKTDARWKDLLEAHDSFFIGSDVFYTYLVQNGVWWIRQKQKNPKTLFDGAREARQRILRGDFPEYIIRRFSDMLDYYGQDPIIVRSSSLLEDAFGNAFAGKYESVFCPNQGTHQQRLEDFLDAVRIIYASTMSEMALNYRAKRGVLEQDEQMALLVQRVSGRPYNSYFFPQMAGVGFSFNPYVWNETIDPEAGMLRLVFGLGTRAVDRSDDDYTRVVALNVPEKRPEANLDELSRFTQRRVDILDLKEDRFTSKYFIDIVRECPDLPVELFALRDRSQERDSSGYNNWTIAFDKIFSDTSFIQDIQEMLKILKAVYDCHVDVEFAVNFQGRDRYKINLLQCRPLQVTKGPGSSEIVPDLKDENIVLTAHGGVIGHSRENSIDQIIYVVPGVYGQLNDRDRYQVARLIGKLTHREGLTQKETIMLIGPGRWGTSTPALGVPVSFNEINTVSVLCEIDSMHEGLVPDLSLGTHFFNDLVEMNILYIAFFTAKKDNRFNGNFILDKPNRLTSLLPGVEKWTDTIHVLNSVDLDYQEKLCLNADSIGQKAVLYTRNPE